MWSEESKLAAMAPAAFPESFLLESVAEQAAPLMAAISGNGLGTRSSSVARVRFLLEKRIR